MQEVACLKIERTSSYTPLLSGQNNAIYVSIFEMLYTLTLTLRLQFCLFYLVNQKSEVGNLFFDILSYCLIKIC